MRSDGPVSSGHTPPIPLSATPLLQPAEAASTHPDRDQEAGATSSRSASGERRRQQVRAAETRLLYENASTGSTATIIIASMFAYAQWNVISHVVVLVWWLYVLLVSAARLLLVRGYWRAAPSDPEHGRWNAAFVVGSTMAAAGWGAAAIALHSDARPIDETFLVFVIGGVMLGGASLLAARPEAFVSFLLPTGLLTALRLASQGDEDHLMMGFLGFVFTAATLATTWRAHWTIESSLMLRFANQELIESLQTAKTHAEALNRDLELRVRDRTAKLVEGDQRKDEFLATLAHELRNPLAAIRFALENLKGEAASPAAAARARDVIDRQFRQLVRLVDDLLDVSRITANKIQLRPEPHELARLMATAVESVLPLATAADQTLAVELPQTPVHVSGDGARLVQVFANILNNAVKFTPRGGQIWFTADSQPGQAVVRIRDTGIGIPADALPLVFDMFHQAEPVLERSTGGLGIGLTLARRLVEMHGGHIEVRSPGPGEGTEVEIRLPTTAMPEEKAVAAGPAAAGETPSLRVLIVEDNLDAAAMLEMAVSHGGHVTRLAHDGASAITIATEFLPDVIFLDIGLPVMNGYSVAKTLRGRPEFNHVHIAALTGWGQEEDRRRARECGFDSHLTKPLSPEALDALLARIAEGRRSDASSTPRTRLADSNAHSESP